MREEKKLLMLSQMKSSSWTVLASTRMLFSYWVYVWEKVYWSLWGTGLLTVTRLVLWLFRAWIALACLGTCRAWQPEVISPVKTPVFWQCHASLWFETTTALSHIWPIVHLSCPWIHHVELCTANRQRDGISHLQQSTFVSANMAIE